jgi:hypothetical protein
MSTRGKMEKIQKIEHRDIHIIILNDWLEVIDDGNSICISWERNHSKCEAHDLYSYFKNQPERLSEEARKGCDSPSTPTKGSEANRND